MRGDSGVSKWEEEPSGFPHFSIHIPLCTALLNNPVLRKSQIQIQAQTQRQILGQIQGKIQTQI